jgi:DNA mismatch endonuclease (patch repair protein)
MDRFSRQKRSEIMSKIRSKWTKPERRLHGLFKAQHIRHRMHPNLTGHPDMLMLDGKIAIFIQGCFWHGCPKHFRAPKTNVKFWRDKIAGNIRRHNRNRRILEGEGYLVMEIWEHQL